MTKERQASIHSPQYREIIDILAAARVKAGVSQVELANRLGMSQSDISKIEGYERRLDVLETLDWARAVCNANESQVAALWRSIMKAYKR